MQKCSATPPSDAAPRLWRGCEREAKSLAVTTPTPVETWTLRVVDAESRAPVPGVPVTLLDADGTPAGYWVSDAAGPSRFHASTPPVSICASDYAASPHRDRRGAAGRRYGGGRGAPGHLLPAATGGRLPAERGRGSPADDVAGALTLRFSRLAVLPLDAGAPTGALARRRRWTSSRRRSRPPRGSATARCWRWSCTGNRSATLAGDLLYTGTLSPGEELASMSSSALALDLGSIARRHRSGAPGRADREADRRADTRERPRERGRRPPLEPLKSRAPWHRHPGGGRRSVRELLERTVYARQPLRRRALRVTEAPPRPPAPGSVSGA